MNSMCQSVCVCEACVLGLLSLQHIQHIEDRQEPMEEKHCGICYNNLHEK
jgi:hypothetical protein